MYMVWIEFHIGTVTVLHHTMQSLPWYIRYCSNTAEQAECFDILLQNLCPNLTV